MTDVETLSAAERSLLSDHDDDFYGLWEVDWHFNGHQPEWPHEERAALVSTMVKRGLFDVFFGPLQTKRAPLALDHATAPVSLRRKSGRRGKRRVLRRGRKRDADREPGRADALT